MDRCGCLPYYYPRLDILLDFDLVIYDVVLGVVAFAVGLQKLVEMILI